jgi:hypothetical protein
MKPKKRLYSRGGKLYANQGMVFNGQELTDGQMNAIGSGANLVGQMGATAVDTFGKEDSRFVNPNKEAAVGALRGAGTGAMIGANPLLAGATGGLSIVAGAAIGGIAGGLTSGLAAKKQQEETAKHYKDIYYGEGSKDMYFKYAGGSKFANGGNLQNQMPVHVQGNPHEMGGVPLGNSNNEVEGNEVVWDNFVFSDRVPYNDSITFAQKAKSIMGKYKSRNGDPYTSNSLKAEMSRLKTQHQEALAKLEQEAIAQSEQDMSDLEQFGQHVNPNEQGQFGIDPAMEQQLFEVAKQRGMGVKQLTNQIGANKMRYGGTIKYFGGGGLGDGNFKYSTEGNRIPEDYYKDNKASTMLSPGTYTDNGYEQMYGPVNALNYSTEGGRVPEEYYSNNRMSTMLSPSTYTDNGIEQTYGRVHDSYYANNPKSTDYGTAIGFTPYPQEPPTMPVGFTEPLTGNKSKYRGILEDAGMNLQNRMRSNLVNPTNYDDLDKVQSAWFNASNNPAASTSTATGTPTEEPFKFKSANAPNLVPESYYKNNPKSTINKDGKLGPSTPSQRTGFGREEAALMASSAAAVDNMIKGLKPEVSKLKRAAFERLNLDEIRRLNRMNADRQSNQVSRAIRGSGRSSGETLAALAAANSSLGASRMQQDLQSYVQEKQYNNQISNQEAQMNNQIANQEYLQNEQNRAMAKSVGNLGLSNVGQNYQGYMRDKTLTERNEAYNAKVYDLINQAFPNYKFGTDPETDKMIIQFVAGMSGGASISGGQLFNYGRQSGVQTTETNKGR